MPEPRNGAIPLYSSNREYVNAIIKRIERISATGHSYWTIWDDFLELTYASLEALPRHFAAVAKTGTVAEDTPKVQELWSNMRKRYPKEYAWKNFHEAFQILIASAEGGFWNGDVLGDTYQELNVQSRHSGQFFTPWHIADLMAEMICDEDDLWERLTDAYLKGSSGMMHRLMSQPTDEEAWRKHVKEFLKSLDSGVINVISDWRHYDPITICDCACGSGVMLMAAASKFPTWASQLGLVQVYGQDIDQTCVLMARINLMIHGMDCLAIKCVLELSPEQLAALPVAPGYREAYEEAVEAHQAGDEQKVMEVTKEFNELRSQANQQQASMFDMSALQGEKKPKAQKRAKSTRVVVDQASLFEKSEEA